MGKAKLSREITVTNLVAYYFSTVVGAGIFVVPVLAARVAGPASVISWIIAILLAYPFAMIFTHISQRYKISGTIQKFIEDSTTIKFGESIALFLIASAMVGNFLLGYTSAGYVADLLGLPSGSCVCLLAFLLISVSCVFNLANIGLSSSIQTFCVFLLIGVVCAVVGFSVPNFNVEHMEPFVPFGYESILAASVLCFYSVTGWENVVSMAEEVKDPGKTYRKAIKVALVLITFFYLSLVFTMLLVMTPEQIYDKVTIMSALLTISVGAKAGVIGSLIAIFLLFLGSNAWVMGTSRLIYALANDRVIPKVFAKVNKDTHIPVGGILAQVLFYAFLAILMYGSGLQDESLAEVASLNYLLLYTVIFFCGLKTFTTIRLKLLATFALLATTTFLMHSTNAHLQISVVLALICFLYVYIIRRKVHL